MKIYIKNMVCRRCKAIVKGELNKLGIMYISVELGVAVIKDELSAKQFDLLDTAIGKSGLELISKDSYIVIENLKKAIVDLEYFSDEDLNMCYSDFISVKLSSSFNSLNTMFSEIEGITIEKYIINHKIELVKQFLIYNKLNMIEIARRMHYSSPAKLSRQFKSITGLSPLQFRHLWLTNSHHHESN